MYLLRLALRPWRSAPLSQGFAVLAIGFLLIFAATLFWVHSGLKSVLHRLKNDQVVTLYLEPGAKPQQIEDQIKISLGAQSKSVDLERVDAKRFVERLRDAHPDLARELEELGSEMHSIVPEYVSVSGQFPLGATEKFKALSGVESVETAKNRYQQVIGAFTALKWFVRAMLLGVVGVLFLGFFQLARSHQKDHSEALGLLKFWGAGEATLLLPNLISCWLAGCLGGVMAALAWSLGSAWMAHAVQGLSPFLSDLARHSFSSRIAALALFSAGSLLGIFAGLMAGGNRLGQRLGAR